LNKAVFGQTDTFAPIVATLENHVAELDQLGAHIAAAYLDAAIHRLRFEDVQLRKTAEA